MGTSQKGGGTFGKATFLAGTGDLAEDNYNAYVSLSYERAEPIDSNDRGFPYSACDTTSLGIATSACVGGSAVGGSIYGVVAPATVTGTNPDGSPDLLTGKQLDGTSFQPLRPCPTPITYPGTGPGTGTGCTYNQLTKFNTVQFAPKTTRASLDGRVTVNLNDSTQAYVNAMFNQFRLESAGGPPAIQTSVPVNTNNIALPPTLPDGSLNPNDPFAAQGQYAKIGYNFGDVTPGNTTDVNHNLRLVGDINGAISADWSYDVAVTAEHTWLNVNNYGFLYYPQLLKDVTNGTYNFVNPSKNSQATRNALSPVIQKTSSTDLDALDAKINGVLAYLPGGPLGFALGGQWRYEAQDDPNLNPGNNYQGLGSAHTVGHRTVAGGYFEFNLPLVDGLEVDLSGREDHYSDFGNAFSPKAGLKWTPIRQFGIRATYSRGFRAPNFAENGSSSSLGFVTVSPPKSFQAAHPSVTGGSGPDPYAQPYGLGLRSEANPDIKPERSRNYTVGLIFQPFEALSGTVDYYNIVKTNVVAPPSPSAAEAPAFAGTALPAGISAIYDVPDPAHPNAPLRPVRLIGLYHNENELRTSGIDLNLKLNQQFGPLNWTSIFHGTDIITWAQTLQNGGPLVKFVGTHGPYNLSSGAGTPRYRANWANTFGYGPFRITGTLYFVSHEKFTIPDLLAPNVCYTSLLSASGNPLPADCQLSSFTHFDLTAAYDVNDIFTVTAGVLSLLGHKAPFDPIDYAANNYNPTYDQAGVIGRFFQVGLTARF